MTLTPADKLALMLTSTGSQRALGAYIGASHQQIGRWLQGERISQHGEVLNVPRGVIHDNIKAAFSQFTRAVRSTAARQGLPYVAGLPVDMQRLVAQEDYYPLNIQAGDYGLRAVIDNTDAMRAELRDAILFEYIDSGRFADVSVRSWVDLDVYMSAADQRMAGKQRTEKQREHKKALAKRLARGVRRIPIYTPHQGLTSKYINTEQIVRSINTTLRKRHQSSAVDYADQILFALKFNSTTKAKRPASHVPQKTTKRAAHKVPAKRRRT